MFSYAERMRLVVLGEIKIDIEHVDQFEKGHVLIHNLG